MKKYWFAFFACAFVLWSGGAMEAQTLQTDVLNGMNWANPTDNSAGAAWPSGMTGTETYAQAYSEGQTVGTAVMNAGGRAVRMPITPTLAASPDWAVYQGAINGVLSTGAKVILCYWPYQSTVVPNLTTWYAMWDAVNAVYGSTMTVRYEPVNEPSGYSAADLITVYQGFLSRYNPPARKCILDGTGYAQNVSVIGAASSLSSQLLGLHTYHWFWGSPAGWQTEYNNMVSAAGSYASRVVVTEIGVQTDGRSPAVNFWQQWEASMQPDQALLSGALAWARNNNVATIQWSGINNTDLYHWFYSYSNLTEANTQVSDMFRWAWKQKTWVANGSYRLQNVGDSYYLDGLGSTGNGSPAVQMSGTSGNDVWKVTALDSVWYTLQNTRTGLYLDSLGYTTSGSVVGQWAGSSSTNQQWAFEMAASNRYRLINRTTGLALDTGGQTTSGTAVESVTVSSSSSSQQWSMALQ